MYVLNKKFWSHQGSVFSTHPALGRLAHLLQSSRFWAIIGSIIIAVIVIAAITAMTMVAMWFMKLDLTTFDPTPIAN